MRQRSDIADITLLLEGTYPFVRGGVSGWVHQLIQGLPEFSFSLVYLGAVRDDREVIQYALPGNVRDLQRHYLMDCGAMARPKSCPGNPAYFSDSTRLHEWFRTPDGEPDKGLVDRVLLQTGQKDGVCAADFFYSEAAWVQINESYARFCPEESFNAYFWAVRNMHGPLIKLASIARTIPPSRIFHSVTTGYAGLLGAMLQRLTGSSLVLTEHGIYTKERKIDLQSLFLSEQQGWFAHGPEAGMEHHHQIWMRLFDGISRLVYAAADPIITLYEKNRQRQIGDGADPARTRIIPNGVDVERFAPLRASRPDKAPLVLGLIGRIVPIKDIKTFIRGIHALSTKMPDVQGWLIGPEEEDPAYVEECKELVRSLQLGQKVRFLGFQTIENILPKLGLLVLSSISEAFPLVILEAFASGLPVVATDVGACRNMIEGKELADCELGCAGSVVQIADPDALARSAFLLLVDPARWKAAQKAGIERVERYYRQSQVIDSYREIYRSVGEL